MNCQAFAVQMTQASERQQAELARLQTFEKTYILAQSINNHLLIHSKHTGGTYMVSFFEPFNHLCICFCYTCQHRLSDRESALEGRDASLESARREQAHQQTLLEGERAQLHAREQALGVREQEVRAREQDLARQRGENESDAAKVKEQQQQLQADLMVSVTRK